MLVTESASGAPEGLQELPVGENGHEDRSGVKPSLAERNRERQQRFRQRQKTRIEELDARNNRLSQQNRALLEEKEALLKNINFLKDLVHSREVHIVQITHKLQQLLPANEKDAEGVPDFSSVDAFFRQHAFTEALQAPIAQPNEDAARAAAPVNPERSSGAAGAAASDSEQAKTRTLSEAGTSKLAASLGLDQLCRVAEMAESQQTEPPSGQLVVPTFSYISEEFAKFTDVCIQLEGQKILLHSAILAASSNYYAKKFIDLRHSQPLYNLSREPIPIDTASPGKKLQDVQAFLRHCYRSLDIRSIANADIMRLIMLADEFECKHLLEECDQLLVERAEHKPFTFFVDLTNGGDMVDWIRLSDQLNLRKTGSVCEMHLARHIKANQQGQDGSRIPEGSRMHELNNECLMRVINKLAQI